MIDDRLIIRVAAAAVLALCVCARPAEAQLTPGIVADRPSQVCPLSAPETVQIESGLAFEATSEDAPTEPSSRVMLLATLLRAGLVDGAELRFAFEYVHECRNVGGDTRRCYGVRNLSIGSKVALITATESRPGLWLFANARLPFGQDNFRPDAIVPGIQIQADYDFNSRAALTANIGSEWAVGSSAMITTYTATLAVPLNPRLSAFCDVAGEFTPITPPARACDVGITFAFDERLQMDLAGGLGITETAPDYFFSSGLCFRIP